jgi:hypothetical protein
MIIRWIGAAAALVATFAAGVVTGQQTGASRREPQFQNNDVEVWKSIVMPNQPLSLHRHDHGRTIVAIKGGTLDVVDAKGTTMEKYVWESGKAYWLGVDPPGTQHADLNRGKEPIEVMVVQMKNDQKK